MRISLVSESGTRTDPKLLAAAAVPPGAGSLPHCWVAEIAEELPKDAGALAWCKCDKEPSFQVALRGFFIILAISLHAVFEGVAMGLGTKASFVWYLCFAVAVHKSIIAFCIGVQVC